MFWQSVIGGIGTLLHWQVWVALLLYLVLQFAWLAGIGLMMGKTDSGGRMAAGCLTHMFGGTVFQSVLLGVGVLFLTPIVLGSDRAMPLEFFVTFSWPVLKSCLFAMAISFVIGFIPIVGRFLTDTPGVLAFIQGIIIFRLFSKSFIEVLLKKAGLSIPNLYPSFWETIGYFILALAFVYACLLGFSALGMAVSKNRYSGEDALSSFLVMTFGQTLGLLPLFMYANHVQIAIRQMVK